MTVALYLLLGVARLGALDTFWHHEWRARLPRRPLEPAERVMHTLIAITYGAFLAVLVPQMVAWEREPTGLHAAQHGLLAWVFTVMAVGVFGSGVRDLIAARVLDRRAAR